MPRQVATHTFNKGMITDTNINNKSTESYDYAENLRHTNDEESVLGALSNFKGHESFGTIDSTVTIVAHKVIRDYLYLLCAALPSSGGSDSIYRLAIDADNKELGTPVLLYGGGNLGLDTTKNTDVIGIYESSDIIKLYWTTEGEILKVANVSTYLTSDGLVKSGSNSWVDSGRFNMLTTQTIKNLKYNGLISGSLSSGRVQYYYSMYKKYLQETIISTPTGLINLYEDTEKGVDTIDIKGDYTTVSNTGKGVELRLSVVPADTEYFDYIRLYRVHYTDYEALPTVTIVSDTSIASTIDTYYIQDTGGVGLGTLTPEEFTILTSIYTVKTITSKDNRAIIGNINESNFDVDFDARAYRFYKPYEDGATGIVLNYNSPTAGSYEVLFTDYIYINVGDSIEATINSLPASGSYTITVTAEIIPGLQYRFLISELTSQGAVAVNGNAVVAVLSSSQIVSNLYESYGAYTAPEHTILGSTLIYPNSTGSEAEYNVINPFNDIDEDMDHTMRYMYQADGTTVGGEGPNIKYSFTTSTSTIKIDGATTYGNPQLYSTDGLDYSQTDFSANYVGFQRDEIYRIGILFYNELGQQSKVKWVGDIRFPANVNVTNLDAVATDTFSDIQAYAIGLTVTFKAGVLPTGVSSWELVRAKRTKNDRSVVTSGYISLTNDSWNSASATGTTHKTPYPLYNTTNVTEGFSGSSYSAVNYDVINFISPEEIFQGFSDIKANYYIDVVGDIIKPITYTEDSSTYPSSTALFNTVKLKQTAYYPDFINRERYTVNVARYFKSNTYSPGLTSAPVYNIEGARYENYSVGSGTSVYFDISGQVVAVGGYHGACSVLSLTSSINNTVFNSMVSHTSNSDLPYVLIKRNNTSRYGGSSYLARENTNYISCNSNTTLTTTSFWGGDTYINFFDYKHTVFPKDFPTVAGTSFNVLFPVETVLNLSLRSDTHSAKAINITNSYLIQETLGVHEDAITADTYTQDEDLYLYNSIYSQEQNFNYRYALNNIPFTLTNFDSRVAYSDQKINNELIDSWLKFPVNNFLDVDSSFGAIEALHNFNNEIYFWQSNAFGAIPVNERSLISDSNPGALALGVGTVMSRYSYISKRYGTTHMLSILDTGYGLYWTDSNKKTILSYSGEGLKDFSKFKGIKTITKELIDENTSTDPFTFINISNIDYGEILFKLTDTKSILYNETSDVISSIITSNIVYLFEAQNIVATLNNNTIYIHDKTNNYNEFLTGTTLTHQDSVLKITNVDNLPYTKVYDNLAFFTYSKNSSDQIVNTDYFNNVIFNNDYQYSESGTLSLSTNLERKERGYSMIIPRNIVTTNGTTTVDIFNAANHNSARLYKERMRDKYLTANLTYNNSDYLFVIPEVQFTYRYSKPTI